jgi:WavE lipopolysaccharide synthesis protein
MEKIDLILQGPCNDYTYEIAQSYLSLEFVNNVILSCWENDITRNIDKIKTIKSQDVEYPGVGNRNRQIKSSLVGMKNSTTEFSIKLRSDQKISLDSMRLMYEFYERHKERELTFVDNPNKPYNRICVAGIFRPFPFHPRDHIFWGNTQDLIDVFDVPYDMESKNEDYDKYLRAEAYLCMWYFIKFDSSVRHYIENYTNYLVDSAPHKNEALLKSEYLCPKIFKPFPKINFEWPKHGLKNYHYDFTERTLGEYWDS